MQVIRTLDQYKPKKPVVLTIGSFDGLHLGHQEIIRRLKSQAEALDALSAVMTFTPHPRIVLNKDKDKLRLLSTDAEKEALCSRFGLDVLFFMPFNAAFSEQSAQAFLHDLLLQRIGVTHLVIGYDHRFGKGREGDIHFLREQSAITAAFSVEEISQQAIDALAISSTKIRISLEAGDVALANKLLGYPYSLHGKVVRGDQIGRKLGYPTANLAVGDPYKQLPGEGVYATYAVVRGKSYPAMTYIGNRPTIQGESHNIETNLLDFTGDLYDYELELQFLQHIRPDIRFESLEALTAQIALDERKVRLYFGI
ncbi:MAG: riboflavin biosynthesis protein RibF [Bacteroidia bacterium]